MTDIKNPDEFDSGKISYSDYLSLVAGTPKKKLLKFPDWKSTGCSPEMIKHKESKNNLHEKRIVDFGKYRFMQIGKGNNIMKKIFNSMKNLNPATLKKNQLPFPKKRCWKKDSPPGHLLIDEENSEEINNKLSCENQGGEWKALTKEFEEFYKGKNNKKCKEECGKLKPFFSMKSKINKLILALQEKNDETNKFHHKNINDIIENLKDIKINAKDIYMRCIGKYKCSGEDISRDLKKLLETQKNVYSNIKNLPENSKLKNPDLYEFLNEKIEIDNEGCLYKYRCNKVDIPFETNVPIETFDTLGNLSFIRTIENAQKIAMGALIIVLMHGLLKK